MTEQEALAKLCRGIFGTSNIVPGLDISSVWVERVEGLPHPEQEQSFGRGVRVQFTIGATPLGKAIVEDTPAVYTTLGISNQE